MKNRLLALMLSSLVLPNVAMSAQEAQCPTLQAEHLKAQYQVTNGKGQQWQMTLIRNGQDFIIQRDGSTFEEWSSNGEYVRYFPAENVL